MNDKMRLKIRHQTSYRFEAPSRYGLQQLRKTPKSGHGQTVLNWTTTVEGADHELSFEDQHRNWVELFSFRKGTEYLVVTGEGEVEIEDAQGVVGSHIGPAPLWLYLRSTERTRPGPGVRALTHALDGADDLDRLHRLLRLVEQAVAYEIGSSETGWNAERALTEGKGVCQDQAHVFVAAARELGYPARYVSGYLMMDGITEQEAMHAWAEAHVHGLGWVGFDPSNGISPDSRYVRVATGLDYAEAAPVTGLRYGGTEELLDVAIRVSEQ